MLIWTLWFVEQAGELSPKQSARVFAACVRAVSTPNSSITLVNVNSICCYDQVELDNVPPWFQSVLSGRGHAGQFGVSGMRVRSWNGFWEKCGWGARGLLLLWNGPKWKGCMSSHPPTKDVSLVFFYFFFIFWGFFVFNRNNGKCRGSGISILNLRSSNVKIVGQERWHLRLCQPNPSEEWAKFSLVQIPFSVTGGNLTAHPLSSHVLLALRSNSFVDRVFSGFLCCSPSWLDNQVHAVDHPGLQSVAAICEELVSI